jgi:KipI family sensor histidine kinase inhibitor
MNMRDRERDFPRIAPCGESALLVEFAPVISAAVNDRVHALAENLGEAPVPGVIETVPAYRSLLVCFDPRRIRFRKLAGLLKRRIPRIMRKAPAGRTLFHIPVCYEGEFAPDMAEVAAHTGFTPAEIIERHTRPRYRIFMLGFLPGFPYLGGLDPALQTPRRKTPRTAVPRGAVGIGGNQTGIYPLASPGGWQLIGQTPVRPYDPRRLEPAASVPAASVPAASMPAASVPVLYKTGDFIAFFAVGREEYAEIEKQAGAGTYRVKQEAYVPPEGS